MSILAPVKPYLRYSMDLAQIAPVVAYYCKLYAVQKGFELIKADTSGQDRSKEKQYLMNELTACESMKANLPEGSTKADHRYVVENFVTSVFTKIEKEERTCETITKRIAADFNSCSHFIMLLSTFGDECYDDGWEEKRKYCVYKAGNILKSLKQGIQPPRGNPQDPTNDGQRVIEQPKQPEEEEKKQSTEILPPPTDIIAGMDQMNFHPPVSDPVPPMDFNQPAFADAPQTNNFMQPPQVVTPPPQYDPQPKMKPQYIPSAPQDVIIPQNQIPVGGGQLQSRRTPEFFKSKELIQKLCKNIQTEMDYGNFEGAIKVTQNAHAEISKYCQVQAYAIQPYQAKPKNATAQQMADLKAAKQLCKDAISELDFGNMDQCMVALYKAAMYIHKY